MTYLSTSKRENEKNTQQYDNVREQEARENENANEKNIEWDRFYLRHSIGIPKYMRVDCSSKE